MYIQEDQISLKRVETKRGREREREREREFIEPELGSVHNE